MRRIAESALGLAAATLLVLLIVPWKETLVPPLAAGPQAAKPVALEEAPTTRHDVSPDAILPLFVAKRTAPKPSASVAPAPTPAPQPAAKAPVAAPWLRYMGRSSAPDGSSSVYLKDTKSGKVIRASQGATPNGWTLISEDEARLVLTYGEDIYMVSKR